MHETNDPRSRGASFAARFLIVVLSAVHPAAVSAASPDESVLGFTARRSQDLASTLIRSAWRSSYAFGDFDADGRDEIAIGIPFATVDGKRAAGRVVILDDTTKEGPRQVLAIFQAGSGLSAPAVPGVLLGYALAVGDFDGDGRDDLAVGAPGMFVGELAAAGAVYVGLQRDARLEFGVARSPYFLGGTGSSPSIDSIAAPLVSHAAFGAALAAGDFDGDGIDDLAVGIPGFSRGRAIGQASGGVAILAGTARIGPDATSSASGVLAGNSPPPHRLPAPTLELRLVGAALAVGDFDGDRRDDLAIGAPGGERGGIITAFGSAEGITGRTPGAVYRPGDPATGGLPSPGRRHGAVPPELTGVALAAGDFDGDRRDDLAVGAPGVAVEGAADAGAVYALRGSREGLRVDGTPIHPGAHGGGALSGSADDGAYLGFSLAAGDFDADGIDDLAIGAPGTGSGAALHLKHGRRPRRLPGFLGDLEFGGGLTGAPGSHRTFRRLVGDSRVQKDATWDGPLPAAQLAAHTFPFEDGATLLVSMTGRAVPNPLVGLVPPGVLPAGAERMLTDGTTALLSFTPQRTVALTRDVSPAETFWRFPAAHSVPSGVRLPPTTVWELLREEVLSARSSLPVLPDGMVSRNFRTRNFGGPVYGATAADDALSFDVEVDVCDTRAICCVTVDVDFDVRFRCTSSGDLEADPIAELDRLTGANLCGDALVSLASTTASALESSLDGRLTSLLERSEIDIPRARCTAVRVLPDRSLELDLL